MPDSTPDKKDITVQEIFTDLPQAVDLFNTANAKLISPPPPTTAVGWAEALGFAPGGLVHTACAAFDKIKGGGVTFDMVSTLIGVDPAGVVGKAGALGNVVYKQSQD